MKKETIDLGKSPVPRLFRKYFIPTLLGMLSTCIVTAIDGIFIGHGVGSDGVAAVNIAYSPMMLIVGVGLMLGVGCSVVASIYLSHNDITKARLNVSHALTAASAMVLIFWAAVYASPERFAHMLGSSDSLLKLTVDYLVWVTPGILFCAWSLIGLFIIRLDGAPRLAMWLNIIPCTLNAVLDYVFIFPLGMGMKGAAIATTLSMAVGGILVMVYLACFARSLRLISIGKTANDVRMFFHNISYQSKIGVSALLGEASMAVIMFMGNQIFMHYLGDDGVGAFGIACYYCPFIFMIGNAIAQSAQPIISFNFGRGQYGRVRQTERLAIITALICGALVTSMFVFMPCTMVSLFIAPDGAAARIAIAGLPVFGTAVVFYIFNLTAIGYFQSVEMVTPSISFALMRGFVFIVPAFLLMPLAFGTTGIWLSLGVSEILTSAGIIWYYLRRHRSQS